MSADVIFMGKYWYAPVAGAQTGGGGLGIVDFRGFSRFFSRAGMFSEVQNS